MDSQIVLHHFREQRAREDVGQVFSAREHVKRYMHLGKGGTTCFGAGVCYVWTKIVFGDRMENISQMFIFLPPSFPPRFSASLSFLCISFRERVKQRRERRKRWLGDKVETGVKRKINCVLMQD